ncbi:MAG TPA: hypothetical protein VF228_18085 [Iamia sp.]
MARTRPRATRRRTPRLPAWATGAEVATDELDGIPVEVRTIQPYQATKAYTCPGCHSPIPSGTGHLVVVPLVDPDDRRHWHRSCWARRHRRRPR